jgi:hypothetical protein
VNMYEVRGNFGLLYKPLWTLRFGLPVYIGAASEEQEICYTRNSYTEIGGEIGGEVGSGEVGKEDYGKMGSCAGF